MSATDRDSPTQIETRLFQELSSKLEQGVSRNSMADLSGVSVSIISRIMSGARAGINLHTAGLLCRYLGLELHAKAAKKPK